MSILIAYMPYQKTNLANKFAKGYVRLGLNRILTLSVSENDLPGIIMSGLRPEPFPIVRNVFWDTMTCCNVYCIQISWGCCGVGIFPSLIPIVDC